CKGVNQANSRLNSTLNSNTLRLDLARGILIPRKVWISLGSIW
ncbi:hypothetical protein LINGRAPRIM_LOCUS1938, partial [Linum grandiflorum]